MSKRQLLLISSSQVHGYEYLQCAKNCISDLLKKNNVTKVLFVPYAIRDHDGYTNKVAKVFNEWGFTVDGIHKSGNPVDAVNSAEALFVGGGNTFQLLKSLYDLRLVEPIRKRVLNDGVPYIGSSAGTVVACRTINTTNDMPIVYPPTFDALNLVPFNINPHYLDHDENSKHKGETREERIKQFQEIPEAGTVLGLREGCALFVDGDKATLRGIVKARLFVKGCEPKEIDVGSDLSYLLKNELS